MSTVKNAKMITCYTRIPQEEDVYSAKLAYSMHLALRAADDTFTPLNHNSGILYAKAVEGEDGVLKAKSLKNPWLFEMGNRAFGVIAQRIEPDGSEDISSRGKILLFTSEDLLRYQEQQLIDVGSENAIEDAICHYDSKRQAYELKWREENGVCFEAWISDFSEGIKPEQKKQLEEFYTDKEDSLQKDMKEEGVVYRNSIPISDVLAEKLRSKLLTPENIANEVLQRAELDSEEQLKGLKATARYSDGTSIMKRVDWDSSMIDWNQEGTYRITGRVHQDRYEFPVAWHRADPCIGKWKENYYFIATNDQDGNHSISIREAKMIPGLVTAQEVKILDTDMYPHVRGLLWAPEFHVIKDRLYIFHAGTPNEFRKEQSHVMALKEYGNPMKAEDWTMPVKVERKDGSPIYGEQGITLDMTEFECGGRYYAVWSQRQFVPVDQGAWLYIAELNPDEPWKLITDPVLLSRPEYGWANNHTFVDEGPFALITDKKLFLTFSSAAIDSTYVVGLLSADLDADLLDPEKWVKENYPLLSSRSKEGEYGPGHNAYVTDEDGFVWNTYHARPGLKRPRCSGIRRVHFGSDGYPVLDLTEEKDLKPELAAVSMEVVVKKTKKKNEEKENIGITPMG